MLKFVISGSRFSHEREILKSVIRENFSFLDFSIYDCNEHMTEVVKGNAESSYPQKQEEINNYIRKCDWFILLASTKTYGEHTFKEWLTAIESLDGQNHEKIVQVFLCTNPETSVKEQGFQEKGTISFKEFENACQQKWGAQFFKEYEYDSEFRSLKNAFKTEIKNALSTKLLIRKHSITCDELRPADIYANRFRTESANGFEEDFYLRREDVDDELENSDSFTIVTGAPASGKTRAIYEFLKHSPKVSPDAKIVVVNHRDNSLNEVADALLSFKSYMNLILGDDISTPALADYYFVFDEINNILDDSIKIDRFKSIYRIAEKQFGARILATALPESIEYLSSLDVWNELKDYYNIVPIKKLFSEEQNDEFLTLFKNKYGTPILADKQVIGDYIEGLVGYNNTVKKAVEDFDRNNANAVENFVKAFSVVKIFRRGLSVPLPLILAVMESFHKDGITNSGIEHLQKFLSQNNILAVKYLGKTKKTLNAIIENDKMIKQEFEYDDEVLNLHVSPNYTISILNDYIWEYLLEHYGFNSLKSDQMYKAGVAFFSAFGNIDKARGFTNPLNTITTLRRIITRCPSIGISCYYNSNAGEDIMFFIHDQLEKLCKNDEAWDNYTHLLSMVVANYVQRSLSFDDFKENYNYFERVSKGRFSLDEDVVAELLGNVANRNKKHRDDMRKFLSEKGWDFSASHNSIFYLRRELEMLDNFQDTDKYIVDLIYNKSNICTSTIESGLDLKNRQKLLLVILDKFLYRWQYKKYLFDCFKALGIKLNHYLLCQLDYRIGAIAKKNSLAFNNEFSTEFINFALEFNDGIPGDILAYHIINMAGSFQNALFVFEKLKDSFSNQIMLGRAVSAMINATKEYEFSFVYRYFFIENDHGVVLPQPPRNMLLYKLIFPDAISVADHLLNKEGAFKADKYSFYALLEVNEKYKIQAASKDVFSIKYADRQNLDLISETFQNLMQILTKDLFKDIDYDNRMLNSIVRQCLTDEQEKYVVENFVKPNYLRQVAKGERTKTFEDYWTKDFHIVSSRLERKTFDDFSVVMKMTDTVVKEMLKNASIASLNPSILNQTLRKLIDIYEKKGESARDEFFKYRRELKKYIFSPREYLDENAIIDYFLKDEYFYNAYYKVFPDEAFVTENGEVTISDDIKNIRTNFLSFKLLSNILKGVLYIMPEKLESVLKWKTQNFPNFVLNAQLQLSLKSVLGSEKYLEYFPPKEKTPFAKTADESNSSVDYFNSGWSKIINHIKRWEEENTRIKKQNSVLKNRIYIERQIDINRIGDKPLVRAVKEASANIYLSPDLKYMHLLFKCGYVPPLDILKIVELTYLNKNLTITPTLWLSVLIGIRRYLYHNTGKGQKLNESYITYVRKVFNDVKQKYSHLIFQNRTTLISEIFIFGEERYLENYREKLNDIVEPLLSDNLLGSSSDYTELIRLPGIFESLEDYVHIVNQFRQLFNILSISPESTKLVSITFTIFIIKLVQSWDRFSETANEKSLNEVREILNLILNHADEANIQWMCNEICGTSKYQKTPNKDSQIFRNYQQMLSALYPSDPQTVDELLALTLSHATRV